MSRAALLRGARGDREARLPARRTTGDPRDRGEVRLSVALRAGTVSDADAVAALVGRAFAHYIDRIGMRPAPMDDDYAPRARAGELFVTGDPIDGAIVIRADEEPAFLDLIAVDPERQRRGLGRELMAAAERFAAERGRDELHLLTNVLMTENRAFYAALGYREIEVRSEYGTERVYLSRRL